VDQENARLPDGNQSRRGKYDLQAGAAPERLVQLMTPEQSSPGPEIGEIEKSIGGRPPLTTPHRRL